MTTSIVTLGVSLFFSLAFGFASLSGVTLALHDRKSGVPLPWPLECLVWLAATGLMVLAVAFVPWWVIATATGGCRPFEECARVVVIR